MMGSGSTTQAKILIADDERSITDGLSAILADEGYAVEVALDGQRALERLTAESYGVILADLKMPKIDGIALLKELQQRDIPTECIIITGQATVDSAVQSMRQGAYDYIEKPLNAEKLNRVKALIPKALERFALHQKNRELASKLEGLTHYGELTGHSDAMRNVYQVIEAVAPSTASVLILGESGTGKELVARAMHSKSDRAKGPFLALNCAALPKDILENELFGHEKGAFTGSTNEKAGAFEMAHGGTLFLDEVAEMPPDIQVKLLRALETRTIRRLGGRKEISVDIRIVAATNRDLQQAIADGDLREDLYYRLAVVELYLPPLRERVGDIKLLANEFLARFAHENNKKVMSFEDAAWDWILAYHWPGNVRELKNAVERAVIMTRGTTIGPQDITPRHLRISGDHAGSMTIQVGSSMADARRKMLLGTFASTDGDPVRTAKLLGVTPADVQAEIIAIARGTAGEPRKPVAVEDGRRPPDDDARRGAPSASAPKGAGRAAPAKAAPKGKAKAKSGRSR